MSYEMTKTRKTNLIFIFLGLGTLLTLAMYMRYEEIAFSILMAIVLVVGFLIALKPEEKKPYWACSAHEL